ncbi:hypothetical protein [Mycobacterium sp. OTB74]|jgi:hypothetical protein|uniref:hypothetical protein n=1 Tax=Mycobacterium sp. OTB74 TaxID=1853452 RepID=UPI002475A68D|nr:hypothetical protein [Mycobacterium sp. OTB74]MDH6248008.1 hypothetical protein [Mycobacterium sp. OTB74]
MSITRITPQGTPGRHPDPITVVVHKLYDHPYSAVIKMGSDWMGSHWLTARQARTLAADLTAAATRLEAGVTDE